METHRIASPPAPDRFHRAMIAYHSFTLSRNRNSEYTDFLSFWYSSAENVGQYDQTDSALEDILVGAEKLRDRAVGESLNDSVETDSLVRIIEGIRIESIFPEAIEYWSSVLDTVDRDRSTVPLSEVGEIVITFLTGNSGDEKIVGSLSSTAAGTPQTTPVIPAVMPRRARWCASCADFDCLIQ